MNVNLREKTVKRIQDVCDRLEDELGLNWQQISLEFLDSTHADDPLIIAETTAEWKYRQAKIRWHLPTAAPLTDDQLERTALHELVHIVLDPIAKELPGKYGVDSLNEFVTESICRMLSHVKGDKRAR